MKSLIALPPTTGGEMRIKKKQLKDIPIEPILTFLADRQTEWCNWIPLRGDQWDHISVQQVFPPWAQNTKMVWKKMASLQKRGLVGGCACGCRGDYVITDAGLALIGREASPDRAHIY